MEGDDFSNPKTKLVTHHQNSLDSRHINSSDLKQETMIEEVDRNKNSSHYSKNSKINHIKDNNSNQNNEMESKSSIEEVIECHSTKFLGNNIDIPKPTYFGNIKVLAYFNNEPLITVGPDCVLMLIYVYDFFGFIIKIIGIVIFAFWLCMYVYTCLTNPGIPSKDYFMSKEKRDYIEESESQVGYLTCSICNVFVKKSVQIGHCLTCKICIIGYDHHCGWSGKCIGQGNIHTFWIFLVMTLVFFLYNLVIFILFSIDNFSENKKM